MTQEYLYRELFRVCRFGTLSGLWDLIKNHRNEIDFNIYLIENLTSCIRFPRTPLMIAANHGHLAIVCQLLSLPEVDINLQAKYGFTAFYDAVLTRNRAVISQFLVRPDLDVNIPVKDQGPAIYAISYYKLFEFVPKILEKTSFINPKLYPYITFDKEIVSFLRRIQLTVILLTTSMFQKQITKSPLIRLIPYDIVFKLCKEYLLLPSSTL